MGRVSVLPLGLVLLASDCGEGRGRGQGGAAALQARPVDRSLECGAVSCGTAPSTGDWSAPLGIVEIVPTDA